jgi:A/G-specific adenine glycosylase
LRYYFRIVSVHPIAEKLIYWFSIHQRHLPWRKTRDPYRIWLSEIILQQTRVAQGTPYYERFIAAFPTVEKLAAAPQQEVLKLWQGLGYYSRARHLHATAQIIVNTLRGDFPKESKMLRKLPGIGPYTAAAIASFGFDEAIPVIDGNVLRVVSRWRGLFLAVDTTLGYKAVEAFLLEILPKGQAAIFNQAVMEFGALHCTPLQPKCTACPLSSHCMAFELKAVDEIPVKSKKTDIKSRFFHYFFVTLPDGKILYRRRPVGDIWEGLYEPILVESDATMPIDVALKVVEELLGAKEIKLVGSSSLTHLLTHRRIVTQGYHLSAQFAYAPHGYNFYTICEAEKLPVSRLIERLREAESSQDNIFSFA